MRTIKDFFTTSEGELCVNKNEYLQVLEKVDRHWLKCRTEHRIGLLPASHITLVDGIPKLSEQQSLFLAISDFEPERSGDLQFKRGMKSFDCF